MIASNHFELYCVTNHSTCHKIHMHFYIYYIKNGTSLKNTKSIEEEI